MREWPMIETVCSGCGDFPCRCRRPVSTKCACGGELTANDTLDDKAQAHAAHVQRERHQRWRESR